MGVIKTGEQRRIKLKDGEKKPVDRKALVLLFLATGICSGFFWWRGKVIRETPPSPSNSLGQSLDVNSDTGADKEAEVKRQVGEERLVERLKEITATASGRYAVYVYRLGDGSSYGFNQTERLPAASIMKVPVMVAVWKEIGKGNLDLTDVYTLDEADRALGSGPLQFKPAGSRYTVEELLTYLGKNSDNTAWVMFNRRLGKKTIEAAMTEMDMADSSYADLVITAEDTAKMFAYIYKGRAGGSRATEEIFGYLTDSIYEDRIPAGIPEGGGWEVLAHKVGTDAGVWADAGIIKSGTNTLAVVILNQEVKRSEAGMMVPDMVRIICEFEENWPETR